jgi:ferric-dicitrate binding protein FerR (iron transport regulator)
MSDEGSDMPDGGVDRIEQLLERAAPRPVPPAEDARLIRQSVNAEWRAQVGRRRMRRRGTVAALAATLAACVIVMTRFGGTEQGPPVEIAQVQKRLGAVYLVQDDAGLVELEGSNLASGQVVQTGKSSGLAFVLRGGLSVRMDEDSRIELLARDLLYLQDGRVYVDAPGNEAPVGLTIRTDQGSITHVGTQYMVTIAADELTVSVREGEVLINGNRYKADVTAGERVTLLGTHRPSVARLATHGEPWRWTESLAPRLNIDGMPADEFLKWVSSETGYRIVYEDDHVRGVAGDTILKGVVDRDPRTELQLRLLTMDLVYDVDDSRGLIRIRDAGTPR